MYNEQIENLINHALADGELTEKEKQILFKKAEAAGIDLDEFEMVLDAKLHEKQQSKVDAAAPKSNKLGDVRKCAACGAIAETFATKCSDCGTEFRNIEASHNITKFFDKLDELESNRKENLYDNQKKDLGTKVITLIKWWFFWWILIPLKPITYLLNKFKPAKWSTTDSRKEELIMNFPVPASREEILEFLNLATSKINSNTYFNAFSEETKYKDTWNKIWLKKIEQIYSKASIAMKNDKKSFEDVDKMASQAREIVKSNNKKVIHFAILFAVVILVIILMAVFSTDEKVDQNGENAKIEAALEKDNFVEAKRIATQLDEMSTDKKEIIARVYKKEILFNIKNKNLQNAEEVFFTCPENSYYHLLDAAPHIVQAYIENNDEKGAKSFIAKINVEYDGGELQTQLKELLE
jgi:hypothetical protein